MPESGHAAVDDISQENRFAGRYSMEDYSVVVRKGFKVSLDQLPMAYIYTSCERLLVGNIIVALWRYDMSILFIIKFNNIRLRLLVP